MERLYQKLNGRILLIGILGNIRNIWIEQILWLYLIPWYRTKETVLNAIMRGINSLI